jgi:hypothetical protein
VSLYDILGNMVPAGNVVFAATVDITNKLALVAEAKALIQELD